MASSAFPWKLFSLFNQNINIYPSSMLKEIEVILISKFLKVFSDSTSFDDEKTVLFYPVNPWRGASIAYPGSIN